MAPCIRCAGDGQRIFGQRLGRSTTLSPKQQKDIKEPLINCHSREGGTTAQRALNARRAARRVSVANNPGPLKNLDVRLRGHDGFAIYRSFLTVEDEIEAKRDQLIKALEKALETEGLGPPSVPHPLTASMIFPSGKKDLLPGPYANIFPERE